MGNVPGPEKPEWWSGFPVLVRGELKGRRKAELDFVRRGLVPFHVADVEICFC